MTVFFVIVQKCHEKRRKINSWATGIEEKPGFPLFPLPLFVASFFFHCHANVLMPHFWLEFHFLLHRAKEIKCKQKRELLLALTVGFLLLAITMEALLTKSFLISVIALFLTMASHGN